MSRAIRDWDVKCKDCGKPFTYSDRSAQEGAARGESRPERCIDCRRAHNRATSRMGAAYLDLAPGRSVPSAGLKPGRLGKLQHPERPHTPDETPPPPPDPSRFGLTDEKVAEFLQELERHQVAIVVAPTGSGKSTFFPYRLLQPPSGLPEDLITRHGTIVVTQPRIEASSSIPAFVAEQLHGTKAGPGRDIGFRNSKRQETDQRNRLVYLTDGTLVNMIRRGDLHDIAVIVLDEAHERSLQIDLIIALLRRELRALPHLKLVIASATIDVELFRSYFEPDFDVLYAEFPGKEGFPVHDRFRVADQIPDNQLVARMPAEVAACAYEILRWMDRGERPADVPTDIDLDGDILCFLHGKRAIREAMDCLRELLDEDPDELATRVEVLELHAELPLPAIRRALSRSTNRKGRERTARWRVVLSTNIAETSLTVEGIRHVVDSGLINQAEWDPSSVTSTIRPRLHSQSGLIQRRGRAGRVAPGMWHCLLTKPQFDALPASTPPAIVQAPLEAVVLAAAAAGVSDPASLRWLPPGPPTVELRRATSHLRHVGALDVHGDPTSLGRELGASREPIARASLLACADTMGCAVEAAVVLAALNVGGLAKLLDWDGTWPGATRLHVDRVHQAVLAGATDDLDAILLLWAGWERTEPAARQKWAHRRFLNLEGFDAVRAERDRLLEPLQLRTKTSDVRHVEPQTAQRLRATIAWSLPDAVYRRQSDGTYAAAVTARSDADLVTQLHAGAAVALHPASRTFTTLPDTIVAVARDRRRRWVSPLEEPTEQVEIAFSVAVTENDISRTTPLLTIGPSASPETPWWNPEILPGDRFEVADDGRNLDVLAALEPYNVVAVSVAGEEDDQDENDSDTGSPVVTTADAETDAAASAAWDDDDRGEDTGIPQETRTQVGTAATTAITLLHPPDLKGQLATVFVSEVGADRRATCRSDDLAQQHAAFAAAHPVGSSVSLTIEAARRFHRDSRVVVLARHAETGLEIVLDRTAFGVDVRDVLLEQTIGKTLPFTVCAVDFAAGLVELTRVPEAVGLLDRLAPSDGTPAMFDAEVVDAADHALFARLTPAAAGIPPDAPIIVFRVPTRELPVRPAEMRVGQTIRLELRRRIPRTKTFPAGDLDPKRLPTGAYGLVGDQLTVSEPVPVADYRRVLKASERLPTRQALQLRTAARILLLRSHEPRTKVIDVTGIRAVATASKPTGHVVATEPDGAVRIETEGVQTRIASRFVSWTPETRPALAVGQEVPLFVHAADPDTGRLVVALRDPAANPYRNLVVGSWVETRVISVDTGHAILAGPGGTRIFLPGRESGFGRDVDLATQLPPDRDLRVRVTAVDPEGTTAECSRFHPTVAITIANGREALLATREPRQAVFAFRDLAEPDTAVSVEGNIVMLRSVEEASLRRTEEVITAALSGPLVRFRLPYASGVTANKGLTALRQRHRVCCNLVDQAGKAALLVAAPSPAVAEAVYRDLQQRYTVRKVRLGRYRREVLQSARAAGLAITFAGPFGPSGQPAVLTCAADEVDAMFAILTRFGIGYADDGTDADPRLTSESVAPPVSTTTVARVPVQRIVTTPDQGAPVATVAASMPDRHERILPVTETQWLALTKRRLRLLGRSWLDDILDDFGATVERKPGHIVIRGSHQIVEDAAAAIYARL